jgi:hypothetical protein
LRFGILSGIGLGAFNVLAGQLSETGFYGQLTIIKAVELTMVALVVLAFRRPARVPMRSPRRSRRSACWTSSATPGSSSRRSSARWPWPPSCRPSTR